jgi:hypothetical protein
MLLYYHGNSARHVIVSRRYNALLLVGLPPQRPPKYRPRPAGNMRTVISISRVTQTARVSMCIVTTQPQGR